MTVTVSPKFQVVIPKEVRERMHLSPGMKCEIIYYDGHLELIPLRPMKEMRGFLKGIKGIDDDPLREKKDRDL